MKSVTKSSVPAGVAAPGPIADLSDHDPKSVGAPSLMLLTALALTIALALAGWILWGPSLAFVVISLATVISSLWISYAAQTDGARPNLLRLDSAPAIAPRAPAAQAGQASGRISLRISQTAVQRHLAQMTAILAIVLVGGYFFLTDLSSNPPGFFSDEAEIGLESHRLLHWNAETTRIPFFYQHIEYTHLGSLPLFTTAPFVGLFGLSDESVRLASVVLSIAAAVVIYLTLRRLRVPYAVVPVLMLLLSPLVIHMSRLNFGHAPSLLFLSLGYLAWVVGRSEGRNGLAAASGLLIGLSAYGQPSFYLAAPLVMGAVAVSEVWYNRRKWIAYIQLGYALAGAILILLPVPIRALTDSEFLRRYREKSGAADGASSSWMARLERYPDYFSFDLLFRHGDDYWITRHSVTGSAFFSTFLPIFLALGIAAIALVRHDPLKRYFVPMFLVLLLFPLPDLITNRAENTPYTFNIYWGAVAIPFVVAYGLRGLSLLVANRPYKRAPLALATAGLVVALAGGISFWRGPYADYPLTSADFWGWQFGPERMIDYFERHGTEYDQFIMTGDFNGAYIFLDFYLADSELHSRAQLGDFQLLDVKRRQLFGVRAEHWINMEGSQVPAKSYMRIVETIRYPNGTPAMYLMDVRPEFLQLGEELDEPVGSLLNIRT